jgi:hypothetical protein
MACLSVSGETARGCKLSERSSAEPHSPHRLAFSIVAMLPLALQVMLYAQNITQTWADVLVGESTQRQKTGAEGGRRDERTAMMPSIARRSLTRRCPIAVTRCCCTGTYPDNGAHTHET